MTMSPTCLMLLALTLTTTLIPSSYSLAEKDALLAFKNSLTDPLNTLASWNPSQPNPCSWGHINCNSQNQVTALLLSNNQLSGHLVPELGSLSSLEQLLVDQNDLSGPIPDELGNLGALHSMILSYNGLSGSIPSSLGKLQALTTLGLDNNQFSGRIPAQIGGLKNLKIAAFNDNQSLCWEFQPTPVFRGDYPMCPKRDRYRRMSVLH